MSAACSHADATLRHRVIASLNKLRRSIPTFTRPAAVELLLAAEIAGHYRSYQVLGPLRTRLQQGDPVLQAMRHSMEQELERIFRLMALLLPHAGLHDAYVGVRSSNPTVRANALEFLDNVLKPELRQLLVPLLDSRSRWRSGSRSPTRSSARRSRRRAGRGDAARQRRRVAALVRGLRGRRDCSSMAWSTSWIASSRMRDPAMRQTVLQARRRLAGLTDTVTAPEPVPASMAVGVGSG